ncbi:hypothetical protein EDB19DRAFT_1673024, partial [Suillus lakei]
YIFSYTNHHLGQFSQPTLYSSPGCFQLNDRHLVAHQDCASRATRRLAEAFKPFLPSLLRVWLARSGSRPLTLLIERSYSRSGFEIERFITTKRMLRSAQADPQLIEILFAERSRWETVDDVSNIYEWRDKFDTPLLRTLECHQSTLPKFNAPNPIAYTSTSPQIVRSISTIAVDAFILESGNRTCRSATHPCLKSMTLPLYASWFPSRPEVNSLMAALADTASCNLRVVDFQTATPLDTIDVGIVRPLISVVSEVTVRGEVICSELATT